MEKDIAIPIALDVWQVTYDYAIIKQYDNDMSVRFQFWDDNQNIVDDKTAVLRFTDVYAVRYCHYNKTRYYPKEVEHQYRSYYLEIPNSSWIDDLNNERELYDPDWTKYDHRKYRHYIFQNNSYWIEIIATNVNFQIETRTACDNKTWNIMKK